MTRIIVMKELKQKIQNQFMKNISLSNMLTFRVHKVTPVKNVIDLRKPFITAQLKHQLLFRHKLLLKEN